jgi:hypothetical protein
VARPTLGDYLGEADPFGAVWKDLVAAVFRRGPSTEDLSVLTPAARTLFLVNMFSGEVTNGGFGQFFSNDSGNHTAETLVALEELGAPLCTGLLKKALTLFPGGIAPQDRMTRSGALLAIEKEHPGFLDELDRTYDRDVEAPHATPKEDLTALLEAYMRQHAHDSVQLAGA